MSLYPHGPLPDIDTIDDPDLLEAILYGEDPTWQPERGPEEGEKEGAAINQDKATQDADSLQNDEDNKSSPDSNTPSSNTSQSDQPLTDTQQALDESNEETTTTTTRPVLISTQSNHLLTLATIPQQAVSLSGMIIDTSITHPQLETHQEASSTSSPVVQSPPAPLTTASEPVNQEQQQQQPLPHQLYTETIPTPLNFTIEQPTTQSTTHTNHNDHASPSPRIHLGPHPIPSNPLNNHPYNNIPPHPPRQPIQPHPFQPNFTPLLTQDSGIVKTIQSCTRNGAVRLNELENEDLDLLLDANMQYLLQYVAHRTSQRPPHSTHTQNDLEPGNIEPYGHQKLQYHAQHQLHSTSQPPHSTPTSLNTKQSQPQPHRNAIKTTPSPTEPPQRIGELHFKGLLWRSHRWTQLF